LSEERGRSEIALRPRVSLLHHFSSNLRIVIQVVRRRITAHSICEGLTRPEGRDLRPVCTIVPNRIGSHDVSQLFIYLESVRPPVCRVSGVSIDLCPTKRKARVAGISGHRMLKWCRGTNTCMLRPRPRLCPRGPRLCLQTIQVG